MYSILWFGKVKKSLLLVFGSKVTRLDCLNARSAPQSIQNSAIWRPAVCFWSVISAMHLVYKMIHVELLEKIDNAVMEHMFIDIASYNKLIPLVVPCLHFFLEIFHEGLSWFTSIIVFAHSLYMLIPDRAFPFLVLHRLIDAHHPQRPSTG